MKSLKSKTMKKILLLSFVITISSLQAQIATTTINTGTIVMPNAKNLLGITYDCRSSMSLNGYGQIGYHNTNAQFIPAIATVFDSFPMSTLRYPANGISNGFRWQQSIGPVATRPLINIVGGSNPVQKMEFGFDEFMAMTAARGVAGKDVQIMVPIYDSADVSLTPTQSQAKIPNVIQSNADWVEYANSPNDGSNPGGGTDWAAVRAANGHALPYGIKIWNMGNEPYAAAEYTSTGANTYINNIVPIIDAMKLIDPTIEISVTVQGKLIPPGGTFPLGNWTYIVLNSSALVGKMHAINAHYFLTEDLANNRVFNVTSFLTPLAAAAQANGYKMIVGDQAHYIPSTSPTQAEQDLAMQWQGANLEADFFLTMSQIPNIERSNFWTFGSVKAVWHPIRKNTNGTYTFMPVADLYKKLSPLFLDNSILATNTSPNASDGNYSVKSGAFASSNLSNINVIAVNRDRINTVPLQINGVSGYTLISSKLLTGSSLTAEVIDENPTTADGNGNFVLPPMSVLLLEYSNSPLGIQNWDNLSEQISIYPNPTTKFLNIVLPENTFEVNKNKITIYDMTGKEVKSESVKCNSNYFQTDVSILPKGIYLLTLQVDKMKYSKTFIVE
jgi:alpha-L-arabinofuranosidase